jgi:hypothetical protein
MRWKFKPVGERIRGVLRLAVDFSSTKPPQGVGSRAVSASDRGTPSEYLTRSDIVAGMAEISPRVRLCFDRYKVPGTWTAMVTIVSSGRVSNVHVAGPEPQTANCIGDAVAGAIFPPFTGQPTTIAYPYVFR